MSSNVLIRLKLFVSRNQEESKAKETIRPNVVWYVLVVLINHIVS